MPSQHRILLFQETAPSVVLGASGSRKLDHGEPSYLMSGSVHHKLSSIRLNHIVDGPSSS